MSTQIGWSQERQLAYQELCKSYQQIDDFRSKLLAALPVASAGGVFLVLRDKVPELDTLGNAAPLLVPIGLFGAAVTAAFLCYEVYGIKKCGALIRAGIALEDALGVEGQFVSRPNEYVNEPFAAGIIYPAVLAGWLCLAFYAVNIPLAAAIALLVFAIGSVRMLKWNKRLVDGARKAADDRQNARAFSAGSGGVR